MTYRWAGQYGPAAIQNASGTLLQQAQVNVYEVGTLIPIALFTDRTRATAAPNPTFTDAIGNLTFFCTPGEVDLFCNNDTVTVVVNPDPADTATVPGTTFTGDVILNTDATAPLQAVTLEQLQASARGRAGPPYDGHRPGQPHRPTTPGGRHRRVPASDAGSGGHQR